MSYRESVNKLVTGFVGQESEWDKVLSLTADAMEGIGVETKYTALSADERESLTENGWSGCYEAEWVEDDVTDVRTMRILLNDEVVKMDNALGLFMMFHEIGHHIHHMELIENGLTLDDVEPDVAEQYACEYGWGLMKSLGLDHPENAEVWKGVHEGMGCEPVFEKIK